MATHGVRASLTSGGPTSVVVEGESFSTITLNARSERGAFTGTAETVGAVPLTAEDVALRGAYDGIGFGGRWQLEMQRAVNPFDCESIATVRTDGEQAEVSVSDLRFQPDGESSRFGGGFITVDGRTNTRSASGINLLPIIGQKVSGEWDLTFVDDEIMENRPKSLFVDERIEDLLLVVSFRGQEEPWSN